MRNIYISGSFSPLHESHLAIAHHLEKMYPDCNIVFELCNRPYQKAELTTEEIEKRVRQFNTIYRQVVVTAASSFLEKSIALKTSIGQKIEFAIGLDTLERVCDKKFYFNSNDEMLRCISKMKLRHMLFHVFPRFGYEFECPEYIKDICVFHNSFEPSDVSSTKIRNGQ